MERYILKYLYDHSENPNERRFLDYFKMQLDNRMYSYGMHDADNYEAKQQFFLQQMHLESHHNKQLLHPRRWLRKIHSIVTSYIRGGSSSRKEVAKPHSDVVYQYSVLSMIDIPQATIIALNQKGIKVLHYGKPAYNGDLMYDSKSLKELDIFTGELQYKDFNQLLTEENYETLETIYKNAVEEIKASNFDAVLVWTSETLECKFIIDVFREIGRLSITLLHGLPGCYSYTAESRVDYLCVWGEEIRNNFIQVGFPPQKVLVAGNMKYTDLPKYTHLRNNLQDVLVLTTAPFDPHQSEWDWKKFSYNDRNLLISYLYSVERVLRKNNVEHARLRPHPKVSKEWLARFIDITFYSFDDADLHNSLSQATICIGQTSSTMLEAVRCGVSYLVYEPSEDGKHRMNNELLVPPFDGSKEYLRVAKTEAELDGMIQSGYTPEPKLLSDWMQPFNAGCVEDLLAKNGQKNN